MTTERKRDAEKPISGDFLEIENITKQVNDAIATYMKQQALFGNLQSVPAEIHSLSEIIQIKNPDPMIAGHKMQEWEQGLNPLDPIVTIQKIIAWIEEHDKNTDLAPGVKAAHSFLKEQYCNLVEMKKIIAELNLPIQTQKNIDMLLRQIKGGIPYDLWLIKLKKEGLLSKEVFYSFIGNPLHLRKCDYYLKLMNMTIHSGAKIDKLLNRPASFASEIRGWRNKTTNLGTGIKTLRDESTYSEAVKEEWPKWKEGNIWGVVTSFLPFKSVVALITTCHSGLFLRKTESQLRKAYRSTVVVEESTAVALKSSPKSGNFTNLLILDDGRIVNCEKRDYTQSVFSLWNEREKLKESDPVNGSFAAFEFLPNILLLISVIQGRQDVYAWNYESNTVTQIENSCLAGAKKLLFMQDGVILKIMGDNSILDSYCPKDPARIGSAKDAKSMETLFQKQDYDQTPIADHCAGVFLLQDSRYLVACNGILKCFDTSLKESSGYYNHWEQNSDIALERIHPVSGEYLLCEARETMYEEKTILGIMRLGEKRRLDCLYQMLPGEIITGPRVAISKDGVYAAVHMENKTGASPSETMFEIRIFNLALFKCEQSIPLKTPMKNFKWVDGGLVGVSESMQLLTWEASDNNRNVQRRSV